MADARDTLADCLAGSALGLACGDALGAPVEGLPHDVIARRVGWVDAMHGGGRFPPGTYTDDTQLMVGLLEALLADDTLPPGLLAHRYAGNHEPWRGYGASTGAALAALAAGESDPAALSRPSYGNGGAMGIAPLGVYFSASLERTTARADAACRTTHHHPEAVAAAVSVAGAAALLARRRLAGEALDGAAVLDTLRALPALQGSPMAAPLERLADMLPALAAAERAERAATLAATFGATLRAIESVPVALGAALTAVTLREAVEVGVNAGGDADTQGAMAGGIAGAYHGAEALPADWLAALENGPQGRDHIRALAEQLAARAELP